MIDVKFCECINYRTEECSIWDYIKLLSKDTGSDIWISRGTSARVDENVPTTRFRRVVARAKWKARHTSAFSLAQPPHGDKTLSERRGVGAGTLKRDLQFTFGESSDSLDEP